MRKRTALVAMTMLAALFGAPAIAQGAETPPNPEPPNPEPSNPGPVKDDRFEDDAKDKEKASGFYVGGGINLYFVDKDFAASGLPITFIDQPSPAALMARGGYAFNEYIAIEAEAGVGGAASEYGSESDVIGDIRVKQAAGAYIVGTVPFGGGAYLLGRAGYSSYTLERDYRGRSAADLEASGPAFGIGGGIRNGLLDLRLDYTFMSADKADTGILGMSVMARF